MPSLGNLHLFGLKFIITCTARTVFVCCPYARFDPPQRRASVGETGRVRSHREGEPVRHHARGGVPQVRPVPQEVEGVTPVTRAVTELAYNKTISHRLVISWLGIKVGG